jgi:hypothetical protein
MIRFDVEFMDTAPSSAIALAVPKRSKDSVQEIVVYLALSMAKHLTGAK